MWPIFLCLAFTGCIILAFSFLMDHKIPPLAFKFGGVAFSMGMLGGLLSLIDFGQILIFSTVFFCTGLILAELRKPKED